ncbi:MAG: enoyl-CoA hydratase-related protein [Acidobacteriota bacterium]|jgi:methylglutaconyl-CoA hydratase|nr:enoyl-CoA hydratase-related protein [Acidobacteriota bacterium]
MSKILTATENSIFTITLNRPEKRNALNDDLINDLKNALREADNDESICAVVIKGAGKDFCSGADLSALQKISESSVLENWDDAHNLMELFLLIRKTKVPVIAVVRGRALAGGCGLATACDLALASASARFGYPEVKIGFVPAMVMAILRRNISEKRAFELATRGFEFDAPTAENFGLINRVFADETFEDEVKDYVADYTRVSRSAVVLSKRLLYQMDSMPFEAALQSGADINTIARMTEDCQNGITKFLKKSTLRTVDAIISTP